MGGPPLGAFSYRRYTVVTRFYGSEGPYTLAGRLTGDSLEGEVPFWSMSATGGLNPIEDIASSESLRGYPNGRFHEKQKVILNLDHRWQLPARKIFGQKGEPVIYPLGMDFGRIGPWNAWSLSTGAGILFNRTFMVRGILGYSPGYWLMHLAFGEDY